MREDFIKKLNGKSFAIGLFLGILIGISAVPVISSVKGVFDYFNLMNKKSLEKALKTAFNMQDLEFNWHGGGYGDSAPTIIYCPSLETQRASREVQKEERRQIVMQAKAIGILQEDNIFIKARCEWAQGSPFWQRIFGVPQEYSFGETLCRKDGKCD